jgi:peroxiredoxin
LPGGPFRGVLDSLVPRNQPASDLAARLGAITLPNFDGRPFRLGSAWDQQTAVLVHLRHFGCLYCRKQATLLKEQTPAFEKLGARIVAIGTGDVAYAQKFRQEFELTFPVLSDDDLLSYVAVGAKDTNLLNFIRPGNVVQVVNTLRGGVRQGAPGKHQRYLGATHVFLAGGAVAYAWLNDDFAHDAPLREVLAAADEL